MKNRWYDKDPTLSMAMSLLQNASKSHQETVARYMFKLMEAHKLLDCAELKTQEDRVRFIFPAFRRARFEMHARHLVELMKHLPPEAQQDMAIEMINYIYILDAGGQDFHLPEGLELQALEDEEELYQPESYSG